MKIHLSLRYLLAFALLTMLCGLSHEMVHHAAGAAICGGWGYKTFNSFSLAAPCSNEAYSYLATLAGPAFTYALMWMGWYRLRKTGEQSRQHGFALIFANFPVNRMLFVLLGANDEQYIVRTMFNNAPLASAMAIVIVLLCTVPPLLAAYRMIKNQRRIWWFLGFYLLPFVFVVLFAGFFLENYLLLDKKILADTVWGIPYLLLLVELICIAGYAVTKKYL